MEEKNLGGRPTTYTKELAIEICNRIANGASVRKICLSEDMPAMSSVFLWLREYKEFSEQYEQATVERTETQHEMLLDLGDEAIILSQTVDNKASNAVVSAVKLKADNLKWVMSKMKPKKYGDKLDMTTNGKDIPTPLLHVLRNNDSNTESSKPE